MFRDLEDRATAFSAAPVGLVNWTSGHRGNTVMEEKVSYIFKLNALRQRHGELFDAVAGAALVLADGDDLGAGERSGIVVAALLGSPDNNVVHVTDLVMTIGDAIAGGEREIVARLIGDARPRDAGTTWATAGKMVEIVRRVRSLDEVVVDRLVPVIRLIGEHPLFLGHPS
ncbi:hypothetical protein ACBY01_07090 [Sphingomonas sp. ac-8]|uniref:hypothetical protein n=1 Tax=Sphingomonas sp. ac-8 TaxID=3242977 RepID=UPI003A8131C5